MNSPYVLLTTVKTAGLYLIPIKSYSKNTQLHYILKWILDQELEFVDHHRLQMLNVRILFVFKKSQGRTHSCRIRTFFVIPIFSCKTCCLYKRDLLPTVRKQFGHDSTLRKLQDNELKHTSKLAVKWKRNNRVDEIY